MMSKLRYCYKLTPCSPTETTVSANEMENTVHLARPNYAITEIRTNLSFERKYENLDSVLICEMLYDD